MTYYFAAEFQTEAEAKQYLDNRKLSYDVISSKVVRVVSTGLWEAITCEKGQLVVNDDY